MIHYISLLGIFRRYHPLVGFVVFLLMGGAALLVSSFSSTLEGMLEFETPYFLLRVIRIMFWCLGWPFVGIALGHLAPIRRPVPRKVTIIHSIYARQYMIVACLSLCYLAFHFAPVPYLASAIVGSLAGFAGTWVIREFMK